MRVAALLLFLTGIPLPAADDLPARIDAAMAAGDFTAARPLAEQWLKQLEKLKRQDAGTARVLQVLGSIEDRLGNHPAALIWLEKAWQQFSSSAASPGELAACAEEAAMAAQSDNQSGAARLWQQRALDQRLKTQPPNPAGTALTRIRLAELLLKSGDLQAAAAAASTAAQEAAKAPDAACLVNRFLGIQAHTMGRWEEALRYFSLARTGATSLGDGAPAMQAALDGQTGQTLLRAGRTKEAGVFLEQAESFFSRQDPHSSEAMAALNNLAGWWLENGQETSAIARLTQVLASTSTPASRPESVTLWLNLASAQHRLGNLTGAAASLKSTVTAATTLPELHPLRAQICLIGAALSHDLGDTQAAAQQARDHARIALGWLARAGRGGDEASLLEFRHTMDPVSPLAAFGSQDPTALADAILAAKGRVLDLLLQAATATPAPPPGLETVRKTLPPGAVLVDFVRWRSCGTGGVWDPSGRYSAMVIHPTGVPQWIDLGPAPALEERIRRVIAASRDAVGLDAEAAGRASLTYQLSSLWKMILAPLLPALAGADQLLLRPDGMLHYLPWGVLRDEQGAWFCERYPNWKLIAFPRPALPVKPARRWRVLAIPDAPSTGMPDPLPYPSGTISPGLWDLLRAMPPLPGVRQEVAAIRDAAGSAIQLDLPEATEQAFAPPPGTRADVIHFAGHGFASETAASWGSGPLLNAGLVMSDSAAGLRRLAAGTPPPPDQDGILFTADAAALPLHQTALIVLSGCETGLGQWQAGEHLTGLRHAFLTAGAGAVASTLWDLNDARTPEMIRRFYQNLAAGEAPSLALTNAQRAWLQSPAAAALTPGRRAALAGAWILESAGW